MPNKENLLALAKRQKTNSLAAAVERLYADHRRSMENCAASRDGLAQRELLVRQRFEVWLRKAMSESGRIDSF